jgi:hypothetical protein
MLGWETALIVSEGRIDNQYPSPSLLLWAPPLCAAYFHVNFYRLPEHDCYMISFSFPTNCTYE